MNHQFTSSQRYNQSLISFYVHHNSINPSHPSYLSARIPTRRSELILILDSIPTVARYAGRRHGLLLQVLDRGGGGVVLGSDFVVEAGVRGGLIERRDFGEVLAVGFAGVLDGLVVVVLVFLGWGGRWVGWWGMVVDCMYVPGCDRMRRT